MKKYIYLTVTILFASLVNAHAQLVEELDLPEFHSISLNSAYTVKVRQFNEQSVKATVEEEIWQETEILVEDGILYINIKKQDKGKQSVWGRLDKVKIMPELTLEIAMEEIRHLEVNGKGTIISENTLNSDELTLEVNGPGSIELDVKTSDISVGVYSSGSISLTGYCSHIEAIVAGNGNVQAPKFSAKTATATLRGSATAAIMASETMNAHVYGPASLKVSGNTKTLNRFVYGSGEIVRSN